MDIYLRLRYENLMLRYENLMKELSDLERSVEDRSDSEDALMDRFVNVFGSFKAVNRVSDVNNIESRQVELQQSQLNTKAGTVFSKIIKGKEPTSFSPTDLLGKLLVTSEEDCLKFLDPLFSSKVNINWGEVLTVASILGYAKVVEKIFFSNKLDQDFELSNAIVLASETGCVNVLKFFFTHISDNSKKECLKEAVKVAARAGQLETLQFLLSEGRSVPSYFLGSVVSMVAGYQHVDVVKFLFSHISSDAQEIYLEGVFEAAALTGRLETLQFFLSQGKSISSNSLVSIVIKVAASQHVDVMKFLFSQISDDIKIKEEFLEWVVEAAALNGRLEMLQFLLSEGRSVSDDFLLDTVVKVAASQHVDLMKFLFSHIPEDIKESSFENAVEVAALNGRLEILQFLLSEGRSVSDDFLLNTVVKVAESQHVDVMKFLFSQIPDDIKESCFGNAVEAAARAGQLETLRFLLSDGKRLPNKLLASIVMGAARAGQLETLRFILSEGRSAPEFFLGSVLISVAASQHVDVIKFLVSLISDNSEIKRKCLEEAIKVAAREGQHVDVLEFLLSLGPISYSCRNSARVITKNSRMKELLEVARVSIEIMADGSFGLVMEDVKKDPIRYLETICFHGLPYKIRLLDSPQTVDAGGVSKQFYTELFSGLAPLIEGGDLPNLANPNTEGDQGALLIMFASWYSMMYEVNKSRSDKFLIGQFFCKEFFDLVAIISSGGSEEEQIKKMAVVLKDKVPLPSKVILDPSSEVKKEYADTLGFDSEEEALEDATLRIKQYRNAALYFSAGISEDLFSEIKKGNIVTVMSSLQGEELSIENLLRALKIREDNSPVFQNQCKWIREKIENSTLEWREQFVKAITGNAKLSSNKKIVIGKREQDGFEIHTCFNSIDLPTIEEKEGFLAALDAAISDNRYNIG